MKIRLAIIIAVMSIAIMGLAQAAGLVCKLCGREISGVYYTTSDGKIYCDACWSNHHICSQCGQLVNSVIKIDGRNYCPNCYARFDKCGLCGKPLIGTYTQYPKLSLMVCAQCEREKPRCDRCGVPSNELIKSGAAALCPRCSRETERCQACGEPIMGDYSFYEGNKNLKYCFNCAKKYPRCDDCGAPSGPYSTKLEDGRYLCPECRKIAYFDAGLITGIKQKVFAFVNANMAMPVTHAVGFSLEDRTFMRRKAVEFHGDLNGLFYRKGDRFDIYVLYGLREKDLIGVLAHEMTHAWQAENSDKDIPLVDQEGFAQWIAYKALIHFGHEDFARLMTEGDNIYAKGLIKVLNIEKLYGTVAVYKFGKTGEY